MLAYFPGLRAAAAIILVVLLTPSAPALEPPPRPLSADRPDSTESPFTVPLGTWQVESSFFSFTSDQTGGTDFEGWVLGETNLKFGLTNSSDLQLVVSPWVYERERTAMGLTETDGVGDVEVRFKQNLWGKDGGATALGLLPYVKIPTGTEVGNDKWEGGLIVPFSVAINDRVALGLQAEVARNFDEGPGHYWALSYTAVVGIAVTDQLGFFVEYVGTTSELPYQSLLSGGVTFQLTEDLLLDAGGLVGLNNPSPDLTVFSGVTARF